MPTDKELRTNQRRQLYQMIVGQEYPEKLKDFIHQLKAEMDEEDIAYVEKRALQLKREKSEGGT